MLKSRVVNTVAIDGAPHLHLFFSQRPGIELKLWVKKKDSGVAAPAHRDLSFSAGREPNFTAE
jgi:hypothetical protein